MTGRVAAVRNRLLVGAAAALLAFLLGWSTTEGLVLLLFAAGALVVAVMRAIFGGVKVLWFWVFRYRTLDIGLRELGGIIGEHADDMRRAGLIVTQRRPQPMWRRRGAPAQRPLPDLVPKLRRHEPYDGGLIITLEAVRAGMSQDDILGAVPRLRSAWGVDVIHAKAMPGGRLVELTLPLLEGASMDDDAAHVAAAPPGSTRSPVANSPRPPDAPTVTVVQGTAARAGNQASAERASERPPSFAPTNSAALEPDEHGRYELTMLPLNAARTFAPTHIEVGSRPDVATYHEASAYAAHEEFDEDRPTMDELAILEAVHGTPSRTRAPQPKVGGGGSSRAGSSPRAQGADAAVDPLLNGGRSANPTDVDERGLRLGAHWRTGRER